MAQRPYIVGNWKMNGTRAMLAEARAIDRGAARYPGVQVAIAPPFTLIQSLAENAEAMTIGGQDCHHEASGAFTGDVSAPLLADAGAAFTIVGHSERRARHGEDSALVRSKADAALGAGIEVIVCVGETEVERDSGQAEAVVCGQLDGSLPCWRDASRDPRPADGDLRRRRRWRLDPLWRIGQRRQCC
jgi:triosephosphate isomerase (TIM)